ncbi:hypothetical protein Salat_2732000 [Sesamum alatum]|uniref:Reverse transcriptase zinc-binding domain-containing protein n=1 Tax=Sesamum alatum TaxID=300844 RepID=A0AAE2C907_9LAMI|nr:hypothetical protein Salat_2732000 [Sesamum alatum]
MCRDTLVWHTARNGLFSVRSAYNLAQQIDENNSAKSSSGGGPSHWDFIWKARVPNRVKNFCWKICKEAVPVTNNLVKRRVLIEDLCSVCKMNGETLRHAFLECPYTRFLWALSDLP